jgi:hypothetical protein
MSRFIYTIVTFATLLANGYVASAADDGPKPTAKTIMSSNPLGGVFYENRGQIVDTDGKTRPEVKYYAFFEGVTVYFTPTGWSTVYSVTEKTGEKVSEATGAREGSSHVNFLQYPFDRSGESIRKYRMDVTLEGCNPDVLIETGERRAQYLNYYLAHCPEGITHVRSYEGLRYRNIYDKIDLVLHAAREGLKYEFEVWPGGDVKNIQLWNDGQLALSETLDGSYLLHHPSGFTHEAAPYSYQMIEGQTSLVESRYALNGNRVQFDVEIYDTRQSLIVDPWSTYYGGSEGESSGSLVVDMSKNIIVAGASRSHDLPLRNAWQDSLNGNVDAIIVKFDSGGSLLWATYLGGKDAPGPHFSDGEGATAVDVASGGYIIIAGSTRCYDFPVYNAWQGRKEGSGGIGIIASFDSTGFRIWSTYFGGSAETVIWDIQTDSAGHIYITGTTDSRDLYTTRAFQSNYNEGADVFYAKFTPDGFPLISSFLGGYLREWMPSIAVRPEGSFAIHGVTNSTNFPRINARQQLYTGQYDGFVTMFDSSGVPLWSTYHGGAGSENAGDIAFDPHGNVLVTGYTYGLGFPILRATQDSVRGQSDVYLSKFSSTGMLHWSTYLGGENIDEGAAISSSSTGDIYVGGGTKSIKFPVLNAAYAYPPDSADPMHGFVACFDSSGVPQWSTFLGGEARDFVTSIDASVIDHLYVMGVTASRDFPTFNAFQDTLAGSPESNGLYPWDFFITRITPDGRIPVTLSRIAAQRVSGGVELTWRSESEVNAYGFIIERRHEQNAGTANAGWLDIGFVPSSAQGTERRDYQYLDLDPGTKDMRIYYRLRMVDLDGSFEHSPVVEVAPESGALAVSFEAAYPSPARDWLTLNFTLPAEQPVTLSIHDITGREIASVYDNQSIPSGSRSVVLPVGEWRSGLYLCTLTVDGQRLVRRAMVVR